MPTNDAMLDALQRMNRLLALVAIKGVETREAVLTLLRAGYTQAEVAGLVDLTPSAVGMIVLRNKKAGKGKRAPVTQATATDGDRE